MLDGHVNRDELTLINSITRYLQPRRVFEFGTFDGLTTLNFALNTPADAEIYTLDLPEGHAQPRYKLDGFNKKFLPKGRKLRFKGAPSASKIKQLMMDSAGLDTFGYGGKFDAVFVDGAHSYEYCKSDSQKAFEMVSRNGVVLWHDYGDNRQWPGVAEYLNYIAREKGYILYWLLKKNTDLMTSLVMHCNGFRR